MAKRDVELVIRAKDEAGKAVEAISAALRDLVKAQDTVAKSAGRTDSTLSRLGAALKGLDTQFRGLSASQKIASEMEKARSAADRLEAGVVGLREESRSFAADAQHAVAAVTQMTTALRANESVLNEERALLDRLGTSHKTLNKAISDAAARRSQLAGQEQRLVTQIATASNNLQAATERYRGYAKAVADAANPSNTLVEKAVAASKAIGTQEQKLATLNSRLQATRDAIAFVNSIQEKYVGDLQKTAAAYERQKAVVDTLANEHRALATAVSEAANRQSALERSATTAGATLAREEASLTAMRAELAALGTASKGAAANMQQLAQVAGNIVTQAVDRQRNALHAAERAYGAAAGDLVKFRTALAGIGDPTTKMVEDLKRLESTAARLKQTFDVQRAALIEMVQSQRAAGGDFEKLAALEEKFGAITKRVAADIRALGSGVKAGAGGTRAIVAPTQEATTWMDRLRRALLSFAGTTGAAVSRSRSLSKAILGIGESSRATMSWTQRLRAEVLSLIAAYVGIFSVIRVLGKLVDTLRTVEAASSRLNAVFDNDFGRVNRELEFIRRNAERLGFQFGVLADEYTKFAVAAKVANFENEATRKIFLSLVEAGRVNKLSIDQLRGSLLALQQMISKGKVTSEELRRQLGDRLPGAFQLMAKAVGVTTAELDKMLKAGSLFSTQDTLLKFANTLDEEFGQALPKSLETVTTAIGRWEQAMFEAFQRIGKAGFNEAFRGLLDTLTELANSAQGASALDKIGRILGGLLNIVTAVVKNIDLLIVAFSTLAGAKAAGVIILLTGRMSAFVATLIPARRGLLSVATTFRTATASAGIFAGAMTAARVALVALLSSTGIGLLVAGIGTLIGLWLTRTEKATAAMTEHKRIVDAVLNAYQAADNKVEDFKKHVEGATFAQAQQSFEDLEKVATDAFNKIADARDNTFFRTTRGLFSNQVQRAEQDLDRLLEAFLSAEIGPKQLISSLDELAKSVDSPAFRDEVARVQAAAQKYDDQADAVDHAAAAVATFSENTRESQRAIDALDNDTPFNRIEEGVKHLNAGVQALNRTIELTASALPNASDAVDRQSDITKKLKEAVDLADLSYAKFLQRLKTAVTPQQAIQSYRQLQEILRGVRGELVKMATLPQPQATKLKLFGIDADAFQEQVRTILRGFDGTVEGAQKVKDQLDTLAAGTDNEFLKDYILGIEAFIDEKDDLIDAADKAGLAVKALAGDVRESALAQEAIKTGNPFGDTTDSAKAAADAVKKLEQQIKSSGESIVTSVDATGRAWTRVGNVIRRATKAEADLARERNDQLQTEGQSVDSLGQSWTQQGGVITRAVGATGDVIVEMDKGIKKVDESTQQAADALLGLQETDLSALKQNIVDTAGSISALGTNAKQTFTTLAGATLQFLENLANLQLAFQAFSDQFTRVGESVTAAWTSIVTQGQAAVATLTTSFTDFKTFLTQLWTSAQEEATTALNAIQELAGVGIDFQAIGDAAVASFETIVATATEQLPLVIEQFNAFKDAALQVFALIVGRFEQLWGRMATDTRDAFSQVRTAIKNVFDQLETDIRGMIGRVRTELESLARKIAEVKAAAASAAASAGAEGKAGGGRIFGRGSGTSDTAGIFALSRDEFVLRARAARRVGYRFLNWLNNGGDIRGIVPGFAAGGKVDSGSADGSAFDLSAITRAFASSLPSSPGLQPLYFQLPSGDTVGPVLADNQVVGSLQRVVNRARVSSAGRVPSYVR